MQVCLFERIIVFTLVIQKYAAVYVHISCHPLNSLLLVLTQHHIITSNHDH